MNWILILLGVAALGLVLYWLIFITEGVYLGRRVVIWLYDVTAGRYDAIKQFDKEDERQAISSLLLKELEDVPDPWLLDVATGTGRVPALLLQEPGFSGRVVGLDAARKMLALASAKLNRLPAGVRGRGVLVHQAVNHLPFSDETFVAVTCLEALEFFPSDTAALQEMVRVLCPGGYLVTSRRRGWEARLFVGRFRSAVQFETLLEKLGLVDVRSMSWQTNYDMVTARKPDGHEQLVLN